jgi:hypothetical protein
MAAAVIAGMARVLRAIILDIEGSGLKGCEARMDFVD